VRRLSYSYCVPLAVPYWNEATYGGILRSFLSGNIVEGPDLGALRSAVVERLGVEDALLFGSGSLALEIALRACDVREGAEVVIPTFCCTSVIPPILSVGALPVLADIGEDLNITAQTVETALTKKTKAVIVPHLFGNPADIEAIVELARPRNIRVVYMECWILGQATYFSRFTPVARTLLFVRPVRKNSGPSLSQCQLPYLHKPSPQVVLVIQKPRNHGFSHQHS
jgi:hypothetical protein